MYLTKYRKGLLKYLLIAAALQLLAGMAAADNGVEIGPFAIRNLLSESGWAIDNPQKVWSSLAAEGVEEPASFLLRSNRGSRIYGMFWESFDGAITARKILPVAVPPSWYREWGLEEDQVDVRLITEGLPTSAEAVMIRATGFGSELSFGERGDQQIFGVWALIPVVFEEGHRLRAGLVRLFFRAKPEDATTGEFAEFRSLLQSLEARSRLRTRREFIMFLGGLWPESGASPLPEEVPKPLPPATVAAGEWTRLADVVFDNKEVAGGQSSALRRLKARFPANPLWGGDPTGISEEIQERESNLTELAAGSSQRSDLRLFHERLLVEMQKRSGVDGLRTYQKYLESVWPQNSITRPPTQELRQGSSWRHPTLGIELVRIVPSNGDTPFWVTKVPVRSFVPDHLEVGRTISSQPTWQEAADLAHQYGLSLPTVEQYKNLGNTITSSGFFWATTAQVEKRVPVIRLGGSGGVSVKMVKKTKRKAEDFFFVLN